MILTESFAMHPAASVSGFYFSHPDSQYFSVGLIGEDQLRDYLARCDRTEADLRRSLAPVIG
jgi:5-methyltetrahydrofolate--homocysteine methyltransferase